MRLRLLAQLQIFDLFCQLVESCASILSAIAVAAAASTADTASAVDIGDRVR